MHLLVRQVGGAQPPAGAGHSMWGRLTCTLPLAATETAQQLKRSAGVPFHAKGRGLLRKMDTTSKAAPRLPWAASCSGLFRGNCPWCVQ